MIIVHKLSVLFFVVATFASLPHFCVAGNTAEILPGTAVEFFAPDGKKIASGVTNDKGILELKISHRGPIQIKISAPTIEQNKKLQFTISSNEEFFDVRHRKDPKRKGDTSTMFNWTFHIFNKTMFLMPPASHDATIQVIVKTDPR